MLDLIKKYSPFIPAFGFTAGAVYSWSYWSSFDINIFQYAGIADVFWISVLPVAGVFLFFILLTIATEIVTDFNASRLKKKESDYVAQGGDQELFRKREFGKYRIYSILYVLVVCIPTVYFNPNLLVPFIFVMCITPAYFYFKSKGMLSEIASDNIRSSLIFLILALLPISYYLGKAQSIKVKRGNNVLYEMSDTSVKRKYLGHVNGTLFLLQENNEKIVILKDVNEILLKKENKILDLIRTLEENKEKENGAKNENKS